MDEQKAYFMRCVYFIEYAIITGATNSIAECMFVYVQDIRSQKKYTEKKLREITQVLLASSYFLSRDTLQLFNFYTLTFYSSS